MLHMSEYAMLQEYIKIPPERLKYGSDSEAFRLFAGDEINKFIRGLPKRINTTAMDKDWDVKSHSLCFAPDGQTLILSILLQHCPTHTTPH